MHTHIIWKVLVEYISNKDQEPAAHHLVNELIDAGMEEDDLWNLGKGNPLLRKVITEVLGEYEDDDEFLDDEDI